MSELILQRESEYESECKDDEYRKWIVDNLSLTNIIDRKISQLSGGELQRVSIAICCLKEANVFFFDEPTSYLDLKQRINLCDVIESVKSEDRYIAIVEHDLAILDYLSDNVNIFYGHPGAYGIVSQPMASSEGINTFLNGYIPSENVRFRKEEITFRMNIEEEKEKLDINVESKFDIEYNEVVISQGNFLLKIEAGTFKSGETIVCLGENGAGKTTFFRYIAGLVKGDLEFPQINYSYKPQIIKTTFSGTVLELLQSKIHISLSDDQFRNEVLKPLKIPDLYNKNVKNLSGGEIQRVAIGLCLGKSADIYLLDEPSSYLDVEMRLIAAKVIKKFIMNSSNKNKTAFIIEHDYTMSTYLADRVILFTGVPAVECTASSPVNGFIGMNSFLKNLNITMRRCPENGRYRINKKDSALDREQKSNNTYFSTE